MVRISNKLLLILTHVFAQTTSLSDHMSLTSVMPRAHRTLLEDVTNTSGLTGPPVNTWNLMGWNILRESPQNLGSWISN